MQSGIPKTRGWDRISSRKKSTRKCVVGDGHGYTPVLCLFGARGGAGVAGVGVLATRETLEVGVAMLDRIKKIESVCKIQDPSIDRTLLICGAPHL